MPLTTTGSAGIPDDDDLAVGFWMVEEGAIAARTIRVFVTYEALWEIERSRPRDVCGDRNV
jgi:hypothetical protein